MLEKISQLIEENVNRISGELNLDALKTVRLIEWIKMTEISIDQNVKFIVKIKEELKVLKEAKELVDQLKKAMEEKNGRQQT